MSDDKRYGLWVASELLPTGPLDKDEVTRLAEDMRGDWPDETVEIDVHPDKMRTQDE